MKNLFLTSEYVPAFGGDNEFPGDYTEEETPDPIPNSEAKLSRPMVVFTGESRSSPGIISPDGECHRGFPFALFAMIYITISLLRIELYNGRKADITRPSG